MALEFPGTETGGNIFFSHQGEFNRFFPDNKVWNTNINDFKVAGVTISRIEYMTGLGKSKGGCGFRFYSNSQRLPCIRVKARRDIN